MFNSLMMTTATLGTLAMVPSVQAQEQYHFSSELSPGQSLHISNIDGSVTVRRASGRTADVTVTKDVRRGNGALVQAIMEERHDGMRVCTVYLPRPGERRTSCHGYSSGDRDEPLSVEMRYQVLLPRGVRLVVATVDGNVDARGVDTPATINTVDGNVTFEGVLPEELSSVDGSVRLEVSAGSAASTEISTVDGDITILLPGSMGFDVEASTVDGDISNDFGLSVRGKWGMHQMEGSVGGGGARLEISTVDGKIMLNKR